MVEDVGSNPYSLILDESTDNNDKKMLGVVLRYVSIKTKELVCTFLSLIEIENGTADCIVTAVDRLITQLGLDKKKCSGIGSDNASVMVGVNNGVHKKLEQLWGTKLVLVRCVCHSIQLAVSSACEELPTCLEFLMKETYNWFANSTARQKAYEVTYKQFYDTQPLKIPQLSNTRWLSRYYAIDRITSQWEVLRSHFNLVRQREKNYHVTQLADMYNDDKNYCYLLFLKNVLKSVDKTNKLYESNKNPFKLLDDLLNLIESLGKSLIQPNLRHRCNIFTMNDFSSYLDPNPHFGYSFEEKLKMVKNQYKAKNEEKKAENVVVEIKSRCSRFILALVRELKLRIPDNYEILRNISELCVEKSLRQVKPKITELVKLPAFCQDNDTIDRIEKQWDDIAYIKWDRAIVESKDNVQFWKAVSEYEDAAGENPFQDLVEFVWKILSLPLSNAEVERVFSIMSIVKDKRRNRMKLRLTNSILQIRFGLKRIGEDCHSLEIPNEVRALIGKKETYQNPDDETENHSQEVNEEENELEDDLEFFIRF